MNDLCAACRSFFTHVDASMPAMAWLVRQGRFADEVMGTLDGG